MVRVALGDVIRVVQPLFKKPADVGVVSGIEDAPSLSSVSDQASEAQFREVLRHSRGCSPAHLGQLIDCVFATEETPQ